MARKFQDIVTMGKIHGSTGGQCHQSHPVIKLGKGTFRGGSVYHQPDDADVWVGLTEHLTLTSRSWPWTKGVEFQYPIRDMHAPANPKSFIKLINYLASQLNAGKNVHVGCVGGHGRTGTVLAALVKVMTGEEDAITWVRKNYCSKAVETSTQIQFLHEHFGITKVKGSKSFSQAPARHGRSVDDILDSAALKHLSGPTRSGKYNGHWAGGGDLFGATGTTIADPVQQSKSISPIMTKRNVWEKR